MVDTHCSSSAQAGSFSRTYEVRKDYRVICVRRLWNQGVSATRFGRRALDAFRMPAVDLGHVDMQKREPRSVGEMYGRKG